MKLITKKKVKNLKCAICYQPQQIVVDIPTEGLKQNEDITAIFACQACLQKAVDLFPRPLIPDKPGWWWGRLTKEQASQPLEVGEHGSWLVFRQPLSLVDWHHIDEIFEWGGECLGKPS